VICGGGRYDRLVEDLGGPRRAGIGFAIGEDRLVEVLPADSPARREGLGPVLVTAVGRAASGRGAGLGLVALLEELRAAGVPCREASGRGGKLFELAESLGSPAVVFVGEDELASGSLSLRLLATREQSTLPRADAVSRLSALFRA
jgi:histidyl-tRNA synthetase